MQLTNRIGNIEQASEDVNFEQIEREIGLEAGDEAQPDTPATPAARQTHPGVAVPPPPTVQNNHPALARGNVNTRFLPPTQQARPATLISALKAAVAAAFDPRRPQATDSRFAAKPANDASAQKNAVKDPSKNPNVTQTPVDQETPRSSRSRFARATVDALMALGALPMHLLVEIGRLRQAKDSRFGSMQRLEKGMAQGDDEALRYAQAHPELVKKKELQPPAPTGPV